MTSRPIVAAALAFLCAVPAASAQPAPAQISQDSARQEQIRRNLLAIKLPPGFAIELFALVPGARALAVAPEGDRVLVGTRQSHVYAIATSNGRATDIRAFAPATPFKDPNGVCFAPDGTLYVAEQNRILAFPAGRQTPEPVVPQGRLIPEADQSFSHAARVCRIGPDDKLYVAIGQPYNVPPRARLAEFEAAGMGAIVRMNRDGTGRQTYASGIRNAVGLDFDPRTRDLWFTDNQVDGMGDDQPPGEINHATRPGQNFGFPWYGGGHTRTREYAADTPPPGLVFPAVEEVAHAADLGMTFYRGTLFPPRYRGAIFSAQHGSWNRSTPIGARVMVTTVAPGGTAASEPFAEGWLNPATSAYSGRPVDVAELPDGSLLISDDYASAIYRITYRPSRPSPD